MPEKSLDLRNEHFGLGSKLECVTARWWSEDSKFVVVDFVEKAASPLSQTSFSLRLDLDKQVFLDHAQNDQSDRVLQSKVTGIWLAIVRAKADPHSGGPHVLTA